MNFSVERIREFIERALRQLVGLSPTVRIGMLVAGTVAVSALIWWTQFMSGPTTMLFQSHDLSQRQQAKIANALVQAELTDFSIVDGQFRVPKDQAAQYLEVALEHGAPPESLTQNQDLELRNSPFFESERLRASRLLRARERDLAVAISTIKGIDDAFVHYDQIVQPGLKRARIVTASVGVVTEQNASLSRSAVRTIRQMVAATYAGMQAGDVTVSDLRSGRSYGGWQAENSTVPRAEEYFQIRMMFEQFWQQKIADVLRFVPDVQVVTSARIQQPPQKLEPLQMDSWAQLAVSVNVPLSYHMNRLDQRVTAETKHTAALDQHKAETERQIRQAVMGLHLQQDELISLAVTTFDDRSFEPAEAPSWRARIGRLTRSGAAAIALLIAATGGLSVHLLSRHKPSASADEALTPLPHSAAADDEHGNRVSTDADDVEDEELRATLTDLVQSDPDNAARILNQWMTRAS